MKKVGTVTLLLAVLLLQGGTGTVTAHGSAHPPTDLKKVGDHWTAWDPPPAGPSDYIIQKNDTLWDLADDWFGDPFLWPQIWDENRYILDSHWIYPGDPLVRPGQPTVVPDDTPPPTAVLTPDGEGEGEGEGAGEGEGEGEGAGMAEASGSVPLPPRLMPAADPSDLYCSGFIDAERPEASELWIAGGSNERFAMGEGDVVFLNRGRNAGVRAGDEYSIIRREDDVVHPETSRVMGSYFQRLGKGRVLIAHEDSATMFIEMSCEEIYVKDEIVPWEVIPVPMFTSMPRFELLDPRPSEGPKGHIVWQRDNISAYGAGHVIYTDLGRISGASPGDFITLFRNRRGNLPRQNVGQAVILTVGPDTSAAKITYSVVESGLGDRVELLN